MAAQNHVQSDAEIRKWVRRKLGLGIVDVELTDEQIDDALLDAKMWFNAVIGQEKATEIDIPPKGGEVDVPADCQAVVEVIFERNRSEYLQMFDWADVEMAPIGYGTYYGSPSGSYSYITQWQQYIEQGRKIISVDRDWGYDRAKRKLHIWPIDDDQRGAGLGNKALIYYLSDDIDLSALHTYEYDLVRKMTLAESMITLGNARSKFLSLPTSGGEQSLNGDALIASGGELRDQINEKAQFLRPPVPFSSY